MSGVHGMSCRLGEILDKPEAMHGELVRVTGIVQGVGFRPFVWHLAQACGIRGTVCNDGRGVTVHAWGTAQGLRDFTARLALSPPPLARIDHIERRLLTDYDHVPPDFAILQTRDDGVAQTDVAPDAATCPMCLTEIRQSGDRRYRYPFTNCTHCGPRFSIIHAIPYDRGNTSMSEFVMCPACQAEYDNPDDRRFHAQPNACPLCGPHVWLTDSDGQQIEIPASMDAIDHARTLICGGAILAIKGIGGIHLACDAANDDAVKQLRKRKHRDAKAFALMARDVTMVQRFARVSRAEQLLLTDRAAPIVILDSNGHGLSPAVAPEQDTVGFMLPYTPLHHLLMAGLENPIILTSGNNVDEPQCMNNDEVYKRLSELIDYALLHDRRIINRLDDSVIHLVAGRPRLLRRARGYTPIPLPLPDGFGAVPEVLAMGAELKNTFTLLQNGRAIVSQHIGDLEDMICLRDYLKQLGYYRRIYNHRTQIVAVDLHDDYQSTRQGRMIAGQEDLPVVAVQHHHAHIAACMAECGLPLDTRPILGVALDGLGMGDDGTLWGAEFLLCDYTKYRRLAYFQPMPLLGAGRASREPWRNTFAYLAGNLGWESVSRHYRNLDLIRFLSTKPVDNLHTMLARGVNSPLASSAGRLFDAVSAALGVCRERVSYEGQAAVELESLAAREFPGYSDDRYQAGLEKSDILAIDWAPMWQALLNDLQHGVAREKIAARFHHGVARSISVTVKRCREIQHFDTVALSGGVFQNRLLAEETSRLITAQGMTVLLPALYPCNDGGLSLGQAVVAAARISVIH